jgi:hypothetical protein
MRSQFALAQSIPPPDPRIVVFCRIEHGRRRGVDTTVIVVLVSEAQRGELFRIQATDPSFSTCTHTPG